MSFSGTLCMHTGMRSMEQSVMRSAPTWPYTMAPWFAPQLSITLYTSLNGRFDRSRRGANQVVGQPLSVRSSRMRNCFSDTSTVHPSASWSTGPRFLTMFIRIIVQGMPPFERNLEEKPPPRKYSRFAGTQTVASRQASASSGEISQKGFIAGFPSMEHCPLPSSEAAPELIRWMMPPAAWPVSGSPVTRCTASGLQ